jgi:hypothetical protein
VETVQDENTFLPARPNDILRLGQINRVPWITGVTSEEGLLVSAGIFHFA